MGDELTLPIFHDPSLAVALMDHADAHHDDDEVGAAVTRRAEARTTLQTARARVARAVRAGDAYPPEDLALLKARLTSAETQAESLATQLRDAADRRLRRARLRRAEVLQKALERPPAVDAVSDRLDRAERVRRLEALDPTERALMLRTAAREHTDTELIRAALVAEVPPWPTKGWEPLLSEADAQEIREWVIANRAPETVGEVRAVWRLRVLAHDLDFDRSGLPRPPGSPPFDLLNASRPLRVERTGAPA
jgi:hypothetical protein